MKLFVEHIDMWDKHFMKNLGNKWGMIKAYVEVQAWNLFYKDIAKNEGDALHIIIQEILMDAVLETFGQVRNESVPICLAELTYISKGEENTEKWRT